MYKDELEVEIAKALSGNSPLDYDVAMLVAKELIPLEERESEKKARAYYCRRKCHLPKELRKKRGIHFRKEKFGVPELPTPIVFMKEFYNEESACPPSVKEYYKIYDYKKVLQYFTTVGVRDMMRRDDLAILEYPSVVLSAWGIVPKVSWPNGRNSTPDDIRELASHIGKLPYTEFLNTIHTFEFYSREKGKKAYNCDIYLERYPN
tara:strand:- start:1948 stop:2565 length:618 start_codon:yes stop_codon:yes gene_type:complete